MTEHELEAALHKVKAELLSKIDEQVKKLRDEVETAFHDNDLIGHRNYHSDIVEKTKEKKEIWFDVKKKIATSIVWAFVVLIVSYIAYKMGIDLKS
jgi:hypothetical protein